MDQTNFIYSNDDQGRVYQNCKFHDHRGWVSDVRGPLNNREYVLSSTISIYSTLILILLRDVDDAFLYHH